MAFSKTVQLNILEVGPRDGLQNEDTVLSLKDKVEFIKRLSATGLKRIEIGSFVSPKAVPQMAETGKLAREVLSLQRSGEIPGDIRFSALVPNERGLREAVQSGLREVAIFSACSDGFSGRNINCSVEESFEIYKSVCETAFSKGLKVRGYLSAAFGCPFEGPVPEGRVVELTRRMKDMGVYEISLSDTAGSARPAQVKSLLRTLAREMSLEKIALHFHGAGESILQNVRSACETDVSSFDGSVGGIGGCPYSKTRLGNIPTERIIALFSGPDDPRIQKLKDTARWLEKKLGRALQQPPGDSL